MGAAAACEAAPWPDLRLPGLPAALGFDGRQPAVHHIDPADAASYSPASYCGSQAQLPALASPPFLAAPGCSAVRGRRALCQTPPTAPALTGPPDWLLPGAAGGSVAGESSPPRCAPGPQAASQQVEEAVLAAAGCPGPDQSAALHLPAAVEAEADLRAAGNMGAAAAVEATAEVAEAGCEHCWAAAEPAPAPAAAPDSSCLPTASSEPADAAPVPAQEQGQPCREPEDAGSLPSLAAWQSTSLELPMPLAADGPPPAVTPSPTQLPPPQASLPDMPCRLQPGAANAAAGAWPYAAMPHAALSPLHLLSLQPALGLLAGGQLQLGAGADVALLQLEVLQLRQEVRGGNAW